jgi:hypothetical protein
MFELLKTKEFKDIKISELTEKAGVSRITLIGISSIRRM